MRLAEPESRAFVRRLLADPDTLVSATAAFGAGVLADTAAVPILVQMLGRGGEAPTVAAEAGDCPCARARSAAHSAPYERNWSPSSSRWTAPRSARHAEAAAAPPAAVKAPVSDEGRGDGTPTLDSDTIIKGLIASGWRVSSTSSDKMDEVVQTNLLAEKDRSAASVAIYESGTWEWAEKLESTTEPPAHVVSFGRTIVRISPGPDSKSNGTVALRTSLTELKAQAREKLGQP